MEVEKYFFKKSKKLSKIPVRLSKTYLTKPVVLDDDEKGVWPELALLLKFKKAGYGGVWLDTFHRRIWNSREYLAEFDSLPKEIKNILNSVNEGRRGGRWDLIVWKGKEINFIESKGLPSRDKIRQSQIDFKNKLLTLGFKEEDFIVAEWDYKK